MSEAQNTQEPIMKAPSPTSFKPNAETMRTLFAGFAAHGKPLRGLMPVEKKSKRPEFEGRFRYMFDKVDHVTAKTFGDNDENSREALKALGIAMTSGPDEPRDGRDGEESGIPALYTYFGQFIDHDITFDPMTILTQNSDPNALTDFRTPALDLDNVYGRGPGDQPYMYDNSGKRFLLGHALDNGAFDLQRNNAHPARALIGDPRNDENSIVSQFQGLMLRFHNRVVDNDPDADFALLQERVRWHYQWVVVNDFLPRIVHKDVLDGLKTNGKYDRTKLEFYKPKHKPFMPVEFSTAAYRLGHSMIRPGYRLNDDTLLPIFPKIDPSGGVLPGLTGFRAMNRNYGIDWRRFIDIGEPREIGDFSDPGKVPVTPDMQKRLQFAYRLDTSIVNPLAFLPASVAPDTPRSLAQRNLLRGYELGVPTGQSVAAAMKIEPLKDCQIIVGKAGVAPGKGDPTPTPLSEHKDLKAFRGKCPLWTYILAEAFYYKIKAPVHVLPAGTTIETPQLGPVGGRIVAEVFLGMLFGDADSYLMAKPDWIPTIGKVGPGFALRHIVAYALGLDV